MPIDNNRKDNKPKRWIPNSLILLMWFLLMLAWPSENSSRQPYSEFVRQVESGQVAKATIGDREIQYELKTTATAQSKTTESKNVFVTRRLAEDPELAKILRAHQVEYSVPVPSPLTGLWSMFGWLILPLLFIWGWSKFIAADKQGGMGLLGMGDSYTKTSTGRYGGNF
jgi:cell division protease FtsH